MYVQSRRSDWQDVQNYQTEMKTKRRQSVISRLDHWRSERIVEEKLKELQRYRDDEDARFREQDREAVLIAQEEWKEAERQNRLLGNFIH